VVHKTGSLLGAVTAAYGDPTSLPRRVRQSRADEIIDPYPHARQRIAIGSEAEPIRMFDMFRQVFESQAYFQGLLGHDYNNMSTEELVEYIKNQVLALLDEGHEALNEVSWKPWAQDTFVNVEALRGELADILCFLVNLALAAGMTAEDFYAAHQEKARRNIKRQEIGYSQREGKCPGCLRAIDDLVAKGLPIGTFGGVDYCSPECITKVNGGAPTFPGTTNTTPRQES
jgi:NTP pyrophosphatase (non-canonical NTP hydrolase)